MRRVVFVSAIALILCASAFGRANATPQTTDEIITDETPEAACDRLAGDPFAGFGPDEWSQPFSHVDFYRALPACTEALEAHPDEQRFALGAAMAQVAAGSSMWPSRS